VILGVSVQMKSSHKQFCVKEDWISKLLADTKKKSRSRMTPSSTWERQTFFAAYVPDRPQGVVRKVWLDVESPKHSQRSLTALDDDFQKHKIVKPQCLIAVRRPRQNLSLGTILPANREIAPAD